MFSSFLRRNSVSLAGCGLTRNSVSRIRLDQAKHGTLKGLVDVWSTPATTELLRCQKNDQAKLLALNAKTQFQALRMQRQELVGVTRRTDAADLTRTEHTPRNVDSAYAVLALL